MRYYRQRKICTKYVFILPEELCLSKQIVTPDKVMSFLVINRPIFTSESGKILIRDKIV